jgi:hypothetical protein
VPPGAPSIENLDEDDWHGLLDVENLLEAYFTIADSTHSTLVGLGRLLREPVPHSTKPILSLGSLFHTALSLFSVRFHTLGVGGAR